MRDRTVSEKLPKIPLFGPSLIHQLRLLGSQQHPQSGVLLTSFSTWGTENSLAEINLESTGGRGGVIKGCNIFGGVKNGQTLAGLWAGALSCNKKKISRAERSWTNPLNALQEAIHYSFTKFCIYCFALLYEFFVHYALRVEKIINMVTMRDLRNFSFFSRGDVSQKPFRTLSLCFGVIGKTPSLFSRNNFVKTKSSASAIALMSWHDVTRSSVCSGVKECGTKVQTTFCFLFLSFSRVLNVMCSFWGNSPASEF